MVQLTLDFIICHAGLNFRIFGRL